MLIYIILLCCFLTIYASNKAVIAVNMQNKYCQEESILYIEDCTTAISNMNYLFAITHDDNTFPITVSNIHKTKEHIFESIHGVELFTLKDNIDLIDDLYIPKTATHFYMSSYSIAKEEKFMNFLEVNKINDIVLGGVYISNSAKDLVALGYNVYIYLPAVGFLSELDKKKSINDWINIGININYEP